MLAVLVVEAGLQQAVDHRVLPAWVHSLLVGRSQVGTDQGSLQGDHNLQNQSFVMLLSCTTQNSLRAWSAQLCYYTYLLLLLTSKTVEACHSKFIHHAHRLKDNAKHEGRMAKLALI